MCAGRAEELTNFVKLIFKARFETEPMYNLLQEYLQESAEIPVDDRYSSTLDDELLDSNQSTWYLHDPVTASENKKK